MILYQPPKAATALPVIDFAGRRAGPAAREALAEHRAGARDHRLALWTLLALERPEEALAA